MAANQTNKKQNLGKAMLTETGNYFITKDGFFFFMTPQGVHLDKYEKQHEKLHCSQYWGDMKKEMGQIPSPLTEMLAKKAALIIKMKLKPLAEKIRLRKAKEARADANNAKIKPMTTNSFGNLRTIMQGKHLRVA